MDSRSLPDDDSKALCAHDGGGTPECIERQSISSYKNGCFISIGIMIIFGFSQLTTWP